MKTMSKVFKVLEIIWLVLTIIGTIMCVSAAIMGDGHSALYLLIFTIMAGIIYSIRKRQRKRMEGTQKEKGPEKK